MKGMKWIGMFILPMVFVIVGITFWFNLDNNKSETENNRILTEQVLVDRFVQLELGHELKRVGWDHSILSVDLWWKEQEDGWKQMMQDVGELGDFAFERNDNVKRILLRVLSDDQTHRLLFALDGRKENWAKQERDQLSAAEWISVYEQQAKITLTDAGEQKMMTN